MGKKFNACCSETREWLSFIKIKNYGNLSLKPFRLSSMSHGTYLQRVFCDYHDDVTNQCEINVHQ